jgi:hypothetical protein
MVMQFKGALALAVSLAILPIVADAGVRSAPSERGSAPVARLAAPTAATERSTLSKKLVTRWGLYVERVYGVGKSVWAQRIGPNLATADLQNLRDAAKRDTFEGAMAVLSGNGAALSDDGAIDRLAAGTGTKALGDLSIDLTFTPIQPCRVVDTRLAVDGPLAEDSERSFRVINATDYLAQGGSATDCGTLGLNATAVAVNIQVVYPNGDGYTTVFPFGSTRPLASAINYTSGAIVNNTILAKIPNPIDTADFTIYTFKGAHYVVDIVGYLAPASATALQCQDTAETVVAMPAMSTQTAVAPTCATGFTRTTTNCTVASVNSNILSIVNGQCTAKNTVNAASEIRSSNTCCRVPGR